MSGGSDIGKAIDLPILQFNEICTWCWKQVGVSLIVPHSHNREVLGKGHNRFFKKHNIPRKRWGMTTLGSTNKCPYMTTVGLRIF